MPTDLKVAALTAGRHVPSARFRVGQYRGPLAELGVDLRWLPAPVSKHPPRRRWARPFWLPASVLGRVPGLIRTHHADVTLFSRELVSTLFTLEDLARKPRILDVDDAVWLHRGGGAIRRLAGKVDLVIAGNSFLADYFGTFCPWVEILPTAVDTERFRPRPGGRRAAAEALRVIGWSGTSRNFQFLLGIEGALARVLQSHPAARLRISADRRPVLSSLPADRVDFVPWSPAGEVSFLQDLDIGLMPLADDDWCRGKCAFKMLLYLACGVPVVVSPVGMNAEILGLGEVGFGARTQDQWVDALTALLVDDAARESCGRLGRSVAQDRFSLTRLAPRLAELLRMVAGRGIGCDGGQCHG